MSSPFASDDTEEKTERDRIVYRIEESKIGNAYQAFCPELLITAFGDTSRDARNALRQQVAEYLEDCDNLGALDESLIEAGFYRTLDDNGMEVWMSSVIQPVKGPDIKIF